MTHQKLTPFHSSHLSEHYYPFLILARKNAHLCQNLRLNGLLNQDGLKFIRETLEVIGADIAEIIGRAEKTHSLNVRDVHKMIFYAKVLSFLKAVNQQTPYSHTRFSQDYYHFLGLIYRNADVCRNLQQNSWLNLSHPAKMPSVKLARIILQVIDAAIAEIAERAKNTPSLNVQDVHKMIFYANILSFFRREMGQLMHLFPSGLCEKSTFINGFKITEEYERREQHVAKIICTFMAFMLQPKPSPLYEAERRMLIKHTSRVA